jgi:hypothetical protein
MGAMPSTLTLVGVLLVGAAVTVLGAFSLLGLIGESVCLLALLGLVLRGACSVTARLRGVEPC